MQARVDYDLIAPDYDTRYTLNALPGVAAALHRQASPARAILEVGCGTGRWLKELPRAALVVGLDRSPGMLRGAGRAAGGNCLVCGEAGRLPLARASFDLVFCVNAIHHFDQPAGFIARAAGLLRPGGRLTIFGMDPHAGRDRWYLYDYFPETRPLDLRRFPSCEALSNWMAGVGLTVETWQIVEHIHAIHVGRAVRDDHFLTKSSTSQLALLSAEQYAAGRTRIETALAEAEAAGREIRFETHLALVMVTATSDAARSAPRRGPDNW